MGTVKYFTKHQVAEAVRGFFDGKTDRDIERLTIDEIVKEILTNLTKEDTGERSTEATGDPEAR